MTSNEAIAKIKRLLFGSEQAEETPAPVQVAMGTATTSDGVSLQWEGDLAVGTVVFVLDEQGAAVQSGEAEYVIEGTGTVKVGADGAVTEITAPEAEDAEPEAEQVEQAEGEAAPEGEQAPSIEERVARLEEGMQMIIDLLNQIAGQQEEYSARMSAIEAAPSAQKVGLGLSQSEQDAPMTNAERRMKALEHFKK